MGHPGAAHRAMGEYYALIGQATASLEQLTLALRQPDLTAEQRLQIEERIKLLRKVVIDERQKSAPPDKYIHKNIL